MDHKSIPESPATKPVRRPSQARPASAPRQPAAKQPAPASLTPGPRLPQRPATFPSRMGSPMPPAVSVTQLTPRLLAPDAIESGERIIELPARPTPPPVLAKTLPPKVSRAAKPMTRLGESAQPYIARLKARTRDTGLEDQLPSEEETEPVCPHCSGAGFVRVNLPVGHPSFGKAQLCDCRARQIEEQERKKLRQLSNLDAFANQTFDSFDASLPGVVEAYQAARAYMGDPSGWLMLQGGYGSGKTHLAAAIANECETAGDSVYFAVVPDLLDHLRAAFAPTAEMSYDTLFERVRNVSLLVLDDLGSENATAWATEKLFQIINHRYVNHMATVITTNSRLLGHADERIRSRLADRGLVCQVVMKAVDYRERYAGRPQRRSSTRSVGR